MTVEGMVMSEREREREERVLLVDIDSKIPNLALMKVSAYHKAKGDKVGFAVDDPTQAYISVILKKNKAKADSAAAMLRWQYPDIEVDIGGPGYDLKKTLPDAIEHTSPDYDLYGEDYSLGFTTRGCIRRCPFCIVPIKEGMLHRVADISEVHDPRHKAVKLLDNNVLADMDNFRRIVDYCRVHDLKVDLSQGLDARLLTEESARLLASIKPMRTWTFAFDSMAYRPAVERAVGLLKDAGINLRNLVQFYVYCDDSSGEYGLESAIERCRLLKEWGTNPWVMLDIDRTPTQGMRDLKRWVNQKQIFWTCDFDDYKKRAVTRHMKGYEEF